AKVQKAEQDILLKGIRLFFEGKLLIEQNRVRVLT
ncbi:phosphoribosylglycinamide formyltransferase, partial [Candidatus Woesearchaeota archaeon CG_4_10_14_0_8_um_filter_47_5]